MDEINEKAIKEIIAYYDNKNEVHDEPSDSENDDEHDNITDLVTLVEEAHRKKEENEAKKENGQTEELTSVQSAEDNTPQSEENETEETESGEQSEVLEEYSEKQDLGEAEQEPGETEQSVKAADEKDEKIPSKDEEKDEKERKMPVITPVYDLSEPEEEVYHLSRKQIWTAVIVTVLIAALASVFIFVDTGFIGRYKQNFVKNTAAVLDKFGIELNTDDTGTKNVKEAGSRRASSYKTVTVPMENAGKSVFANYRGGIVCAYTNYLSLIGSDGALVWENTTTIVDPILKTAGNYILIAEKGGRKLCLYNDSRMIYETDAEDNILTCNVSSNGDTVIVTEKSSYKGAIAVFNRDGNQVFAWYSGNENIISADISAVSRRVAVALLNSDDKVRSTIQVFDMNQKESLVQAIFEDTILFEVDFIQDTIDAFGDNCIAGLTSDGELIYDKRFENAEFVHYGADEKGNKILLFDNTNIPLVNIYNSDAVLKHQFISDELPDFVNIFGKYIAYNSGRDIVYGKTGRNQLAKYTASMDIKELIMLDENTVAIVYSNNIEIVRM